LQPKNKRAQTGRKAKRRGRPPSGLGTPVQVRLKQEQLALLDKWIMSHPHPRPTRPAAIREILMKTLSKQIQSARIQKRSSK
jgi:hypothetical protein